MEEKEAKKEATDREQQKIYTELASDEKFWLLFWSILFTALVTFGGIAFFHDYRRTLLDQQSPVVETCVQHRLNQKVVVQ